MAIHTGPCEPWPFEPDCCDLPDDTPQATIDRFRRIATSILHAKSGRRWGPSCPIEVRPCKRSCLDGYPLRIDWYGGGFYGSPWIPYIGSDGAWRNASVCGCSTDCACGPLEEIKLDGPVHDIVSVQDGETVLPASAYRVDNGSLLVRVDGNEWPDCQDLAAAPGQPDTLTVTYRTGLPLDDAAIFAFSAYVCHLAKSCGSGCGCPGNQRNLTRVQRQGVEVEFADPMELAATGFTGVGVVDQWLKTVNPYGLTGPSRVMSPDVRLPRVTTHRQGL